MLMKTQHEPRTLALQRCTSKFETKQLKVNLLLFDIGKCTKPTKRSSRKIVNAINDFSRAATVDKI